MFSIVGQQQDEHMFGALGVAADCVAGAEAVEAAGAEADLWVVVAVLGGGWITAS